MHRTIIARAPGKVILMGEHAVVYGKPALLSAVSLSTTTTLTPSRDSFIHISLPSYSLTTHLTYDELMRFVQERRQDWLQFIESGNFSFLKRGHSDCAYLVKLAAGEALMRLSLKPSTGFELTVASDIPAGSCMGSSAAVSASVVAGIFGFFSKPFNRDRINEIVYEVEKAQHGRPSGGDNTTSVYGGFVWFRKETETIKLMKQLSYSPPFPHLLVVHTGTPRYSTGEMVAYVRRRYERFPRRFRSYFDEMESLTRSFVGYLPDLPASEIIPLWKEYQRVLDLLGVTTLGVRQFVSDIESLGGAVKVTGAGSHGSGNGGMVLCIHSDPSVIKQVALRHGFSYFDVQLGAPGVSLALK